VRPLPDQPSPGPMPAPGERPGARRRHHDCPGPCPAAKPAGSHRGPGQRGTHTAHLGSPHPPPDAAGELRIDASSGAERRGLRGLGCGGAERQPRTPGIPCCTGIQGSCPRWMRTTGELVTGLRWLGPRAGPGSRRRLWRSHRKPS